MLRPRSPPRRPARFALLLAAGALAAGCVNLAPPYRTPAAPVSDTWPADAAAEPGTEAAAVAWTEFYVEPALRELIGTALDSSRDLRLAVLDLERARAQFGIVRSLEVPSLGVFGTTRAAGGSNDEDRRFAVDIGIAGYELDFFGRVRNLREQALEGFLGRVENLRAARIVLVAEVANAWLTLVSEQQRIAITTEALAAEEAALAAARDAWAAALARTGVHTLRAELHGHRTRSTRAAHLLPLLVGRPLDAAALVTGAAGRGTATALLGGGTRVGPGGGLPSALLQRRPDVLVAERNLRAANANIGIARAARFPRIALTATVGTASSELRELFSRGTYGWTFAPQISLPIFDSGALSSGELIAENRRDAAIAAYDRAVQGAFREVADALATRRDIGELIAARDAQAIAAGDAASLAATRADAAAAFDTRRRLHDARQALVSARLAEALNLVNLYAVLGGGWDAGVHPMAR